MPQLRREARPLLRIVNGKQHASEDDHETLLLTPPGSNASNRARSPGAKPARIEKEEDIFAEPLSSEDEATQHFTLPTVPPTATPLADVPEFKLATGTSVRNASGTRLGEGSDPHGSDSDGPIFSSQSSQKRPRTSFTNVHVWQPHRTSSKSKVTYGKKAKRQLARKEEKKIDRERKKVKSPGPIFQQPKSLEGRDDIFRFKGATESTFQQPKTAEDRCSDPASSPWSLSDVPPTPDAEEVAQLALPTTEPYVPQCKCSICGTQVPRMLKEDFEDQFNQGRQLSYKWQQRFCKYHRQQSAREAWEERGYPQIKWETLEERLKSRRHVGHVKNVIKRGVQSVYLRRMEESVKGGNKTLLRALKNEDGSKKAGGVGYYGPRGEKLMTDFILSTFSSDLRSRAVEDKLLAASGIAGGVSGFVQSVLVPELAVSLVTEDLGPESENDAVEVLAESADLGELLNPEMDDRITGAIDERRDDE